MSSGGTVFRVGDRVGAKAEVSRRMSGSTNVFYGRVINVGIRLVWVRDHLGGMWGMAASSLEHVD